MDIGLLSQKEIKSLEFEDLKNTLLKDKNGRIQFHVQRFYVPFRENIVSNLENQENLEEKKEGMSWIFGKNFRTVELNKNTVICLNLVGKVSEYKFKEFRGYFYPDDLPDYGKEYSNKFPDLMCICVNDSNLWKLDTLGFISDFVFRFKNVHILDISYNRFSENCWDTILTISQSVKQFIDVRFNYIVSIENKQKDMLVTDPIWDKLIWIHETHLDLGYWKNCFSSLSTNLEQRIKTAHLAFFQTDYYKKKEDKSLFIIF